MTNKEMINKFKDYADCADASYAILHYVDENEIFNIRDDEFRAKVPTLELQGRWVYADNIKLGYKKDDGMPTAYALAIEARFSQNMEIKKDKNKKPKKIDNRIQNFIKRPDDDADISKQTLLIATTKQQQDESKGNLTHILSTRTKNFVNRYELIEHQPNTDYGFSATLFKDTKADSKDSEYILAIRGTEITPEDLSIDIILARGGVPMQCYELARFYEEQVKKHLDCKQKLIIVGHSLGGYLAQLLTLSFATAENANIISGEK